MIDKPGMNLDLFVKRFLTGRINWSAVPRLGVTNFGNVVSVVLYRKGQFQVELLIGPTEGESFPAHRHPDVDSYEFPLSGENMLAMNGVDLYDRQQVKGWIAGAYKSQPVHISPDDWHSAISYTPYAFLSIQHWLHGVTPTSVGLNWIGETSSREQAALHILHNRMV